MKCLFINIASHEGLLACVTEESIVASRAVDHRIGDHELIPLVEDLLKEASWSYQDLTHVACIVGPGGFTSLRVAVSFANTLVDQLKIPSVGIHLSDLYSARVPAVSEFIWLHSTKKKELFVCEFAPVGARHAVPLRQWRNPTLITINELPNIPKGTQWVGELIEEHLKIVDGQSLVPLEIVPTEEILPDFLQQQTFDAEILHPWYGRGW